MAENASLIEKTKPFHEWLRAKKNFPHVWCPGCGLGVVLGASIRAFDKVGYKKNETVLVSGIGCTGRIPVYVDCNTLHTTHGRALTFATGIKLANPDLKVIVFMGDGDALAIGGNHFIHAARRNIDLTAIVVNNYIYGMTGGQHSPTTPMNMKASTTIYGNMEPPFDACALAQAAGATFVARTTVFHTLHMEKMIVQGMQHKGFSMIEIISNCHTAYGRLNKLGDHIDMLKAMRDNSIMLGPKVDQEKARETGKTYVLGVLHETTQRPEYCEAYEELVAAKARGGA